MKGMYRIIIISLLAVFVFSCKSNQAKEIYSYPHASLESVLNSTSRFEAEAPKNWGGAIEEYDKKGNKKNEYWDYLRFAFYNDSLFAAYSAEPLFDKRNPSGIIIKTGKYKFLQDSIIDVYFRDKECIPEIRLNHDRTKKDSITLHLKTKEGNQSFAFYSLNWSLSLNDSIIMPERAIYPGRSLWFFESLNSNWSDSEKIGKQYPSEIKIRKERFYHLPVGYCFEINLKDVQKNYLNVVDLRESPGTESVNDITIYYSDAGNYRMYPEHFQLKKKGNHLILLNKDGSESDIALKILDNTVVK